MKNNRLLRVGEELKKVIAETLNTGMEEYRGKFISVSEVRVSKDLNYADVWVMIMSDKETQTADLATLNHDAWRLRKVAAGKVYLRHIPELRFHLDTTLEKADRIDELLKASHVNFDGE